MELLDKLKNAMARSENGKPKIGGFPYLAECLRQEGFTKNTYYLPSSDSFYYSTKGSLVVPGKSVIEAVSFCPNFSEEELISALRSDQARQTTFAEFLKNTWKSGVVRYEVDFVERYVIYFGINGEEYKEIYPEVEVI